MQATARANVQCNRGIVPLRGEILSEPLSSASSDLQACSPIGDASEPIVRKMSQEMNKVARDPALREHLFGLALTPQPGTPEELGALLRKDFERYGKLVRQLNLRVE